MKVRGIELKAFLDGIPIPIQSINVSSSVNSPSVASINVAPHKLLTEDLMAKAHLIVFFRYLDELINEKPAWYLIFEGEYISYTYTTGGNKAISMQFMDLTNIIESTPLWMFRGYLNSATPEEIVGGAEDGVPKVDFSTRVVVDYFKTLKGTKNTFLDVIEKTIGELPGINSFYKSVDTRLRLTDRFQAITDSELLANYNSMKNTINNYVVQSMAAFPQNASFMQMVDLMLSATGYIMASNATPISVNDNLCHAAFMPRIHFCMPPLSNVIFPCNMSTFSTARNFMSEPTRAIFNSFSLMSAKDDESLASSSTSQFFIAPDEVQQMINQNLANAPSDKAEEFKRSMETDDPEGLKTMNVDSLTYEEKIRGVIKIENQTFIGADPMVLAYAQTVGQERAQEASAAYRKMVNYSFFSQRYANRSFTASGDFSPHMAVGFPTLYLDKTIPVFGYLVSCEHTISKGRATTKAVCSHVRNYDEAMSNYFPSELYSSQWKNENIGSIYRSVLGCSSICDLKNTYTPEDAVKSLYASYVKAETAGSATSFAQNANTRSMPTMEDYLSFLGIPRDQFGEPDFNDDAFMTLIDGSSKVNDRQQLIAEYANIIGKGYMVE